MYQISTLESGVIGYIDTPLYCKKLPHGSPQILRERNRGKATGIFYKGTVYNLPGYDEFPNAETAMVAVCDAGAVLNEQQTAQQDTDEQTIELAYRLALIELEVM